MNDTTPSGSGPLTGIRILDLSRILAAPFATQLLGDLGAEVIKVERPGVGDDARQYGPPYLGDPDDQNSAFYLSVNRNKHSITVDHSLPEGADLIRRLAQECDVVVENFRTGVLAKYGLDHASLLELNPGLIYCSVTGFGQDGPYAMRAGYDGIFQAMSGMMTASGIPDSEPGAGPMKVGVSMVDILTGLYTSTAILAALRHRDGGGGGQSIDISLLDCGLASLSHFAQNYLVSGVQPPRRGNGGFGGIPSQSFTCSDGEEVFVVASTPKQFAGLASALERPELVDDPRFATVSARIANRDAVLDVLTAIFGTRTRADWVARLEAADVPCSPVNDLPAVFSNPQVRHRGMLRQDDSYSFLRNPIQLSATPIEEYRRPPQLGEDTRQVLSDVLGLSADELDGLRESGAV